MRPFVLLLALSVGLALGNSDLCCSNVDYARLAGGFSPSSTLNGSIDANLLGLHGSWMEHVKFVKVLILVPPSAPFYAVPPSPLDFPIMYLIFFYYFQHFL